MPMGTGIGSLSSATGPWDRGTVWAWVHGGGESHHAEMCESCLLTWSAFARLDSKPQLHILINLMSCKRGADGHTAGPLLDCELLCWWGRSSQWWRRSGSRTDCCNRWHWHAHARVVVPALKLALRQVRVLGACSWGFLKSESWVNV
eukprot:12559407-Alexandrium_andersonii.AAC.1